MCTMSVSSARKRISNPLGLKEQKVLSYHMGAENQTWLLKENKCSQP